MAISIINFANTFAQWMAITNTLVNDVNAVKEGTYTKSNGSLILATSALFTNTVILSGNTNISDRLIVDNKSYFGNTIIVTTNSSIDASGSISANSIAANSISVTRISANGHGLHHLNSANLTSNTISGKYLGSNLDTLTFGTYLTGTSYNGSSPVTIGTNSSSSNGSSTLVARSSNGSFEGNIISANKIIAANSITTNSQITTLSVDSITANSISANGHGLHHLNSVNLTSNTISGKYLGSNLDTLTFGTYLTGGSYNGSSIVTINVNDASSSNGPSTLVARSSNGSFEGNIISANTLVVNNIDMSITFSNTQIFTANGTWTKPSTGSYAEVFLISGGGGGSSGERPSSNDGNGGGGGGGGGMSRYVIPLSALGATEPVEVGLGGTGGAPETVNGEIGNPGTNGGQSKFGSGNTIFTTFGGLPGSSVSGGSPGTGLYSGATGGAGGNFSNGSPGLGGYYGGAGGGGGGSGSSGTTGGSGGAGGVNVFYPTIAGGIGGNTTTKIATSGNSVPYVMPTGGGGGGGGGYSTTSTVRNGANGGLYGGGGGGGSAGQKDTFDSGAGGNGANGIVIVITH